MTTDIVISFDTTGSMYPCLVEVRRNVAALVADLFAAVPDLRVGLIAHGDYIDKDRPYVTKELALTDNQTTLQDFIRQVDRTNGGDAPECYELVLHKARYLGWRPEAKKALVMIGDDEPHAPDYPLNYQNLDWAAELAALDVPVYAVHCLPSRRRWSEWFYEELASRSGGYKLTLQQFNEILQLLTAVFLHQTGESAVEKYGESLLAEGRLTWGVAGFINTLTKGSKLDFAKVAENKLRRAGAEYLTPVPLDRFQRFDIARDQSIRDFVEEYGAEFRPGRGFYELTKPETIQERKEVVLADRRTGDMFSGAEARRMLGLPFGSRSKLGPRDLSSELRANYRVFVQSTSYNRKLRRGQGFLYEAD